MWITIWRLERLLKQKDSWHPQKDIGERAYSTMAPRIADRGSMGLIPRQDLGRNHSQGQLNGHAMLGTQMGDVPDRRRNADSCTIVLSVGGKDTKATSVKSDWGMTICTTGDGVQM